MEEPRRTSLPIGEAPGQVPEDAEPMFSGPGGVEISEEQLAELMLKDSKLVTDWWRVKYEQDARRNWDVFYKLNKTNFFKDRHYLDCEFTELTTSGTPEKPAIVLEIGCGVGNTVFPLLESNPGLFFHACDFSIRAVTFVKENPLYQTGRCNAFCADMTCQPLTVHVAPQSVDFVTLVFVLSSIHPDKMVGALANIAQLLKPGGCVLFRDYGLHDMTQLRFAKDTQGAKLEKDIPFYVRKDGTRAYFYSEEEVKKVFHAAGLETRDLVTHRRVITNRRENKTMHRRWVQGRFARPEGWVWPAGVELAVPGPDAPEQPQTAGVALGEGGAAAPVPAGGGGGAAVSGGAAAAETGGAVGDAAHSASDGAGIQNSGGGGVETPAAGNDEHV